MYRFYIILPSANYASASLRVHGNYNYPTWRGSLCFPAMRALTWSGVSHSCNKKAGWEYLKCQYVTHHWDLQISACSLLRPVGHGRRVILRAKNSSWRGMAGEATQLNGMRSHITMWKIRIAHLISHRTSSAPGGACVRAWGETVRSREPRTFGGNAKDTDKVIKQRVGLTQTPFPHLTFQNILRLVREYMLNCLCSELDACVYNMSESAPQDESRR